MRDMQRMQRDAGEGGRRSSKNLEAASDRVGKKPGAGLTAQKVGDSFQ